MVFIILAALALSSLIPGRANHSTSFSSEQPLQIPQGPMGVSNALASDPYWFQQGVQGDSSTYKSVGARVTIRTVYDSVDNDAHSYWVGTILANDAFVQVGYLNEPTTTNHYYCCAWFFEYFPPGNTNSPPFIGPAGSAGPIGSWHTYSMNYNISAGVGVWSFYMDKQYLGSSPTSGQPYYLGSTDFDSGSHAPAALSEVAQATVNTDVIGPAEFKNFQWETSLNNWNDVSPGQVHWGYGATSSTNLPNPYSVAEIVGVANDFLSGSNVPYPGPSQPGIDECGNYAAKDATIWPVAVCLGQSPENFSFVDENGTNLNPNWISLNDSSSGKQIFYTDYSDYNQLKIPSTSSTGQWTVNQISWHSVNVATNQIVNMSNPNQTFSTLVFSTNFAVVGYFYSLPVKDATVILYLPDSTNQTLTTNDNGEVLFRQLPPSSYSVHITVPFGITANQVHSILGPGSLVARVFSLPELVTIIVPPIVIAVLVAIVAVRKDHQRQAAIPAQVPMQPVQRPSFCMSCGQPLPPVDNFCAKCGTPVRTMTA